MPRLRIEPAIIKQLNESGANRYSFVCNVVLNVYTCQNVDRSVVGGGGGDLLVSSRVGD